MKTDFDLAIVGSGFGGSLLAMIARRLGLSVILLERSKHPRFAIGESTSPLANLLLEEIAGRYDLPRLLPLTTYGPWQRAYPQIVCGLKRGFTYFHHEAHQPYQAAPDRANQLLVAASPCDDVADTHWLRADVDHFLINEAIALGAEYRDETQLERLETTGAGAVTLEGQRRGAPVRVRARLVIDASGPRGFLSQALHLPETTYRSYPPTQAFYSHFTHVQRCDQMDVYHVPGEPPYPPDDAALHHIFDGGWMWVLRFNNGVTSAGFAVTDALAEEIGLTGEPSSWTRFLARYPSIGEQFADTEPIRPFVYTPRLAYRCSRVAGDDWALLPSAAGFVDPLFSTGMPLTLLGIERLGRVLEEAWGTPSMPSRLREYASVTLEELDWTAQLIAACYAAMRSFSHFAAFSMFYFVAASFSEMARRLNRGHLVRRFLAADHPVFAEGLRACSESLLRREGQRMSADEFEQRVARCAECLNVAGLCDPGKKNWYGVDLNDVVVNAEKLGYTPEEMRQILACAPWAQIPPSPQREGMSVQMDFLPESWSGRARHVPTEERTARCTWHVQT